MIRPALATRVPGEESLRIAFYGGPNVFTHPLLLASMKSKPIRSNIRILSNIEWSNNDTTITLKKTNNTALGSICWDKHKLRTPVYTQQLFFTVKN